MKICYRMFALMLVIAALALVLAGCSGNGSGGTAVGAGGGSAPSFHMKGSSQLIALSNTVAASGKPSTAGFISNMLGKSEPFSYAVVNQGLSGAEIKARLKGKATAPVNASASPVLKGTNLLAVDAQGNATLGITADFMVKVMYSVTDPKGEYVYLALDTGFVNPDGNDYSQFIAANNCAIYRVSLADNSYSCVKEGVYLQPIDDKYNQTVSANVKPIQFDAKGFVYFPGAPFTAKCDNGGGCSLYVSNWNPKIYRYDPSNESLLTLTQDNQKISYYLALNTGEIAYQSVDNYGTTIFIWQPDTSGGTNPNGVTINLTGSTNWISFFAADTYNTIIYGGAGDPQRAIQGKPGIRFAKPAPSGALKAVLDTKLFNQGYGSNSPAPAKVIVGDDGKMYGVFGPNNESRNEPGPNGTTVTNYYDVYRLYQVLPALSVAKVEILGKRGAGNQPLLYQPINIYGGTPFQVANGYFFYKETKELIGYGLYDVIQMVDLNTRKVTTLLDGGVNQTTLYQIYSWRVRGNKLYFSALDLGATQVLSGKIDTTLVAQGALQSTYLSTKNVASAVGATSRVQDVEGTASIAQPPSAGAPFITKFFTQADNLYSMGMAFSRPMNEKTVEDATSVVGAVEGPIAALKIWIQNSLHLIPDLDVNNSGMTDDALRDLNQSTPLNFDRNYTLSVAATALDRDGNALIAPAPNPSSRSFKTLPYGGWYISENSAKFAGPVSSPTATYNDKGGMFDMNIYSNATGTYIKNVPTDFRIEFDAKNTTYTYVEFVLFDKGTLTFGPYYDAYTHYAYGNEYLRNVFAAVVSSGNAAARYSRCDAYAGPAATDACTSTWDTYSGMSSWWAQCNNYQDILNGNWAKYRIEAYDQNLKMSYSTDGGTSWTTLQNGCADAYAPATINTMVRRRPENGTNMYELFMYTNYGGLSLTNLAVWKLDASGNVVGSAPIMSENFQNRQDGTAGLDDVPQLDGTVMNKPNLKTRIDSNSVATPGVTPTAPYNWLYAY